MFGAPAISIEFMEEAGMTLLRKAAFEPLVGQEFFVTKPDGYKISVTLTGIEENHLMKDYESFHLTFEPAENESPLPDNSYWIENDRFGKALIFISATPTVSPDPGAYYYESVFNVYLGRRS
jgi:hypothetical protein